MKFDVYCDESHQDVFWSRAESKAQHLMIGSLWLPWTLRGAVKREIDDLRKKHGYWQEIKWNSITKRFQVFYEELIDLFMQNGDSVRFRCIAVEASKVDLVRFHEQDAELGFYKFYYQLIKHWIQDFNEYNIFCDEKTNRKGDRLSVLRRTLDYSNIAASVISVQALPSKQVVLIQLCDLLLGAASARLNSSIRPSSPKEAVLSRLEQKLQRSLSPTGRSEQKFNVFKINLKGGW